MTSRRTRKTSRDEIQWLTPTPTGDVPSQLWRDNTTEVLWQITPHWAVLDGRAVVVGLDIRSFRDWPRQDGPPIREPVGTRIGEVTQRVLRGVPLSTIREATRSKLAGDAELLSRVVEDDAAADFTALHEAFTAKGEPRKRLPAATSGLLDEVARLYLAAVAAGDKTPARSVEDALRAAGVPVSERGGRDQVRKWIQRARERGLIPPVSERR